MWKVILATLVIFATGVGTGSLLMKKAQQPDPGKSPGSSETNRLSRFRPDKMLRDGFLQRLEGDLALAPDQRQRIEEILRDGQEQTREIWQRFMPEMKAEMEAIQEKIRAELTPEQQERFEELMERHRRSRSGGMRSRDRNGNPKQPMPSNHPPPGVRPPNGP